MFITEDKVTFISNSSFFQLINIIESKGETNEIEKFKLHINEIDTITSVLLKLSARLAKVENDLSMLTDDQTQLKVNVSNKEKEKYSLLTDRNRPQEKKAIRLLA